MSEAPEDGTLKKSFSIGVVFEAAAGVGFGAVAAFGFSSIFGSSLIESSHES